MKTFINLILFAFATSSFAGIDFAKSEFLSCFRSEESELKKQFLEDHLSDYFGIRINKVEREAKFVTLLMGWVLSGDFEYDYELRMDYVGWHTYTNLKALQLGDAFPQDYLNEDAKEERNRNHEYVLPGNNSLLISVGELLRLDNESVDGHLRFRLVEVDPLYDDIYNEKLTIDRHSICKQIRQYMLKGEDNFINKTTSFNLSYVKVNMNYDTFVIRKDSNYIQGLASFFYK